MRPHLCLSSVSLLSLLCSSLTDSSLHSTFGNSSAHCSYSCFISWQLAILPKMLFFQVFTQLTVCHSSNLVSDMNSSEKVYPHPLTKAALLCPTPVPWTSTLPVKIEITLSQKYWLYVLHCKSRTKYNIWHILGTQDIFVSWNTDIFLKVPYSYVYKYTHTHTLLWNWELDVIS